MKSPLVSICCITYNHAPFIRKCFDGFLMQKAPSCVPDDAKMSDWCEILIHDDCSTDGTTEIIREYTVKYPDLIFPLYEIENQYSKGKAPEIDLYNYKRAKGKYIAYCEGDDYWTETMKLRWQVDFLESHNEYSVCFHAASIKKPNSEPVFDLSMYPGSGDIDVSPELFLSSDIGQPLSMVFRLDCYSLDWCKYYTNYCDTIEIFHLLREGNGRFMRFVGGQYNVHTGGVSADMKDFHRSYESLFDSLEMYTYTKDDRLAHYIYDTALWFLKQCDYNKSNNKKFNMLFALLKCYPLVGLKVLKQYIKRKIVNITRF